MHRRFRVPIVAVTILITMMGRTSQGVMSDQDGDGIDDTLEYQLASGFFPLIHYMNTEQCPDPSPRPVLFRARHPSVQGVVHTNYVLINYVQLYAEDCGDNGHNGDNEAFEIFLKWDGANWQFDSISANAHWGAPVCEKWTSSRNRELWVGNNKHGTYAEQSQCGCGDYDHCGGLSHTRSHVLYNAGEPSDPLLYNLGVVNAAWDSEQAWFDEQFLSAGRIRDQFYNDRFYTTTPTPEYLSCLQQCDVRYQQCVAPAYDERCDAEYTICTSQCSSQNYWDR